MSDLIELRRAGAIEVRGAMLAATSTTTVEDEDGKRQRLIAGVSRVAAGHWLSTRYPGLFVPEPPRGKRRTNGAPPRARATAPERTSAPSPKPLELPRKPLVRFSAVRPSGVTVELRERAYLAITDQAFVTRSEVETGGGLFGWPSSSHRLVVRFASDPGAVLSSRHTGVRIDRGHLQRQAERYERDAVVGAWHTHPHPDDKGVPTDPEDLDWFASHMRELGATDYVALILTPTWGQDRCTHESYASWVKPTVHAWHMRHGGDDQFVCSRAEVVRCYP
jgi:hypothetical protein